MSIWLKVSKMLNADPRQSTRSRAGPLKAYVRPFAEPSQAEALMKSPGLEQPQGSTFSTPVGGRNSLIVSSEILSGRILVVSHREANGRFLEIMLRRAGYLDVTTTHRPTSVCDLHLKNQYDLILLTLRMPGMDGLQVIEALSQLDTDSDLSVLAITAQPREQLRALRAGAIDFVTTPFDRSQVLTRIHHILRASFLNNKAKAHRKMLDAAMRERSTELRKSEEMFRDLVANIPEALWVRDVEHQTIKYVNPAWQKLNGSSAAPGDPLDKVYQTVHPDDLKWVAQERRKAPGKSTGSEYRVVGPDQSVRWVCGRTFPIANPSGRAPWLVEIIEDITHRREVQRQLVHLARHDALTNLPNRTFLYESLRDALIRVKNDRLIVSVLLVDIDDFKRVNDGLGHAMGDALLCEFAARLAECVRPGDTVGRLGGDEFAIIVLTPEGGHGAAYVANRIQTAMRRPIVLEGRHVEVTTSIGIASYPTDTSDLEMLIRYADAAMYEAKAAGKDAFRCYTEEMRSRAMEKSEIEGALRFAQARDEFVLHYQPTIEIGSGKLTRVEALIRWNRPGHGLLFPGRFIRALEESGLMVPVGAWVIDMACRQIREWQSRGLSPIGIAVNLSSRQIRQGEFVSKVAASVREHGIDPKLLEFEITEGMLMGGGEASDAVLVELKKMGISICIDDFGTGYSNLTHLRRFPVDAVKIDLALIRGITTNPNDATIAIAIINMAHSLRLRVVAEGVETREQLDFLRAHGCDEVQGYLLSRPLPVDEFEAKFGPAISHNSAIRTVNPNARLAGARA